MKKYFVLIILIFSFFVSKNIKAEYMSFDGCVTGESSSQSINCKGVAGYPGLYYDMENTELYVTPTLYTVGYNYSITPTTQGTFEFMLKTNSTSTTPGQGATMFYFRNNQYSPFWFYVDTLNNTISGYSINGGSIEAINLGHDTWRKIEVGWSSELFTICVNTTCDSALIGTYKPPINSLVIELPVAYQVNHNLKSFSIKPVEINDYDSVVVLPYPLAEWDIVVAEPYYNEDDIYGYDVYFPQSKLIPFVFNTPDDVNRASSSIAIWETSGTSSTPIIIKNNLETDNFGDPYNGYIEFSIPIDHNPKLYSAILIDEYGFFRSYYNFITKIGTTSPSYENYLLGKRMEKYRNDYCEGVATSTGTFLDDIRYSFECTAKKFVAWLFIPSDDIKNELSTSVKNLSNEFPISIMTGMRNLMYQSKLETSTSSARVYMGTFIYSGYTNAYDDVVFFDPEWIPQNLGEVWQLFYNAMTYIMWLGFAYYIFSRIFGVVSDEQEQEFIYTEQQELAYKGQFTGTGRAHRSKLKNINTRDKVRFYHK